MTRSPEQQPRLVPTFAVIDLDRTLFATDQFVRRLYFQLSAYGVSHEQIERDVRFIDKQTGSGFDALGFLRAEYGNDTYEAVLADLHERAAGGELQDDLLCPGAADLIEALEMSAIPYAVLTYGEEAAQREKIGLLERLLMRSPGQTMHAHITQQSQKARWISQQWGKDETGIYVPDGYADEPVVAGTVVVIDDKVGNLLSDSEQVLGILVNNSGQETDGQLTTLDIAMHLMMWEGSLEQLARYRSLKSM